MHQLEVGNPFLVFLKFSWSLQKVHIAHFHKVKFWSNEYVKVGVKQEILQSINIEEATEAKEFFFVDYQTHSDNAKMQSCLQNISKICVEEPYTEEYPCYPDYLKEIGPYFGIWCLFISFLGMFGNLLTILAIPYAANRKKYVNLESCFTNISEIFLFPN